MNPGQIDGVTFGFSIEQESLPYLMRKVSPESMAFFRRSGVLGGVFLLIVSTPLALAQSEGEESAELVAVDPIPDRFVPLQDDSGYFWQAKENGALTSGTIQYLQSGLNLIVN
ncbi:MAG: hypothetical protein AAGC68_14545, partial [Verrucomicrobiota bacterium]